MKRLFVVVLFALGMTHSTRAQEQPPAPQDSQNVAADFAQTSASTAPGSMFLTERPVSTPQPSFVTTNSFASLTPPADWASGLSLADPAPAARVPSYRDEGIAYRMDLSVSLAVVRFRSSVYLATAVGESTSFSYFLTDHLAIESAETAAFAPTIYQNEHVKFLSYGAGPRYILWGRGEGRWEPWARVLVGGAHLLPQTALGGKNGFDLQVGGGVDWGINPRLAVRLGADWIRTQLWGQTQNSGQATLGLVYRF